MTDVTTNVIDDVTDEQLHWFKSRHSPPETGRCVETAFLPDGGVAVRHSKDPEGSVLRYTADEWDAFLKGAKDGEFDLR